jgi:hypothetical protein
MDDLPSDRIRNGGPFVVSLRRNPDWSIDSAGPVACDARCWKGLSSTVTRFGEVRHGGKGTEYASCQGWQVVSQKEFVVSRKLCDSRNKVETSTLRSQFQSPVNVPSTFFLDVPARAEQLGPLRKSRVADPPLKLGYRRP